MLFVPRQYIKPSMRFCKYGVEDVFELLNAHDQELTLDGLVQIQKQSTLEEADEPEPDPELESKERTMMVSKLTGAWTCSSWRPSVWGHWFKQVVISKSGQGITRMLACHEESMKEKKKSFVSPDFSVWFLQVIFRDFCITLVFLDIGGDDWEDPPTVRGEVPPQIVSHLSDLIFVCEFFITIYFSSPKQIVWSHASHPNIVLWENLPRLTSLVSESHDVNSGDDCNIICTP